ncbi:MAG: hypothetical protein E7501_05770 [Ruminococcus sp.]|nr:hypothetical protein [Ruminococcus sp.]MBQ8904742.1 hypothetical protein [Ruminococcus sp.]
MAKNLSYALLLDLYGVMLTEKQRKTLELYYFEDLSLAEIAAGDGISRQAVRDLIKRGEQLLTQLEEKLGFLSRLGRCNDSLDRLSSTLAGSGLSETEKQEIRQAVDECRHAVRLYTE